MYLIVVMIDKKTESEEMAIQLCAILINFNIYITR
jgi:hypothetical protein